jgi:uncharacterized phiE125 gp8 family phage protein
MGYRLITPPASTPVTMAEVKDYLRVAHNDEDIQILQYIRAATSYLDGRLGVLGRCLITQTWEITLDAFPPGEIELPLPPVQSVTSVTFVDPAGTTATVPANDYTVDTASATARIVPKTDWPDTAETVNAVTIRFVTGTEPVNVPGALKDAVLVLVAARYNDRIGMENPAILGSLIAPYRTAGGMG